MISDPRSLYQTSGFRQQYNQSRIFTTLKKNPLAASGILPFAVNGFPLTKSRIPLVASGIFLSRQKIANDLKRKQNLKKNFFSTYLGYACIGVIRLEKFF